MIIARLASILKLAFVSALESIVVSIPACHAGDRGSIPRRGDNFLVDAVIICISMVIKIVDSSETFGPNTKQHQCSHFLGKKKQSSLVSQSSLQTCVHSIRYMMNTVWDKYRYSIRFFYFGRKLVASAGNRTRAARVAGEHSTTEPPMHTLIS